MLTLDRVNRPRVSDMTAQGGANSSAAASAHLGSTTSASSGASSKSNPEFPEQIRHAQFYNEDKIITVASGNKLYFYQFELPLNEKMKDHVKRL